MSIYVSQTQVILVENLKTACVKMRFKKIPRHIYLQEITFFTALCLLYQCVMGGQAQNQAEEILFK